MPICETHMIEKCPICKPHIKATTSPLQMVAEQTAPAAVAMGSAAMGLPMEPIRKTDTPEITDPAAKNMLVLAQEYAQAQDEVTILRGMVKNLRSHLTETEDQLENAVRNCATKQRLLADAVMTPPMGHKFTTVTAAAVRVNDKEDQDAKEIADITGAVK